jgi:inosine/xanthosine triphosphate pyrophosphatase family protein
MKKILFATGNMAKVNRFLEGLLAKNIQILTLKDIDINLNIEENGKDAIENALIKARAYYEKTKIPTLAMDDTLYLENVPINKQPGMYVRRVGGKTLSDDEMISYYSALAKEYGNNGKLTARWIYGMALINNGEEHTYTWNKDDFYIVSTPSNIINPGYPLNTISINKKLNKYFTDMTVEDKLEVKEDESDVIEFISENILS